MSLGYHDETLAPGVPVIAIPTTAGTGAETNTYGVITDETVGRKGYVGHESVLPRIAILDPELTIGLPPGPTAATGVDAMSHSLESLLSKNPNPFAEAIALGVIRTIGEWLPRAVDDGTDLEARSRMLLAAHYAGVGQQSGTGVGAVHAIGHAIGTRGRLPHGTALATVMPEVFETYIGVRDRELALVAVALGVAGPRDDAPAAARAAIDAIRDLLVRLGQRRGLAAQGLGPDSHDTIARDAIHDDAIDHSPRRPSHGEILEILAQVR
jgi:alcohol dehydrogenase